MALPTNVAICTVTGMFVATDGTPGVGSVTFTPVPARILDATATPPTTIIGTPITATVTAGAFTVDLPATDDDDLNPTGWTYHVAVRLGAHAAYSFCMDAPEGAVDLADVTPIIGSEGDAIITGPPGPPGTGEGIPEGGAAGEVLAKVSGVDFDTDWVPASAPGVHASTHAAGSSDPVTVEQSQVTGLVAGLAAKQPLDADLTAIAALAPGSDAVIQRKVGMWVASTPTEYKTDLALTKSDVGLGNVDNTSDASKPVSTAQSTALAAKADKATTITPTAPLAGGGDLSTNRTLTVATFGTSAAGVVPASGGGVANFLRADGTWVQPPGTGSISSHVTFSYNATTTEPPTGNQMRLNNATQTAATRLWVSVTTVDGLDVSIGLARVLAGHQIYIQDRDDASKWVKYNVTADGVDDGTYYDFAVAYHSGPANVPTGQVELQSVAPGTVGVPPGGTLGQVLAKESAADYDLEWVDQTGGGGGGITTEDAVDAVATALTEGTGIDLAYDDTANTITVTVDKTELSLVKGDVGLGNVDNTADTAKPVSTATQTALDAKQPLDADLTTIAGLTATTDNVIQSVASAWASRTPTQLKTTLALVKGDVGLGNVDNTADTAKPVSTAQQTALDLKQDKAQTINAQTGTTYTLVIGDAGKIITLSNAAAITVTVPTNASVAFPTGTSIDLIQLAAGQFTVTGAGPPTISRAMATAKSRVQYSVLTLIKTATDVWILTGDAAAS